MTDNLLTWNLPNFFTVGLMALVFGAVLGLICAVGGNITGIQFPGSNDASEA